MQIYENQSKCRYQMLVGKTCRMWKDGKTPEEISIDIKQPIDKVMECIEYCKKAEEKRKLMKSKTCGGCIYDKENCECLIDCLRDDEGYYTGYRKEE